MNAVNHKQYRGKSEEVSAEYEPYRRAHLSMHQMGSCRMGSSPQNSVTDSQGHCWDVAGLYVADASCFPTASGTVINLWLNPLLHTQEQIGRQACTIAHASWFHLLYNMYACDSFVLLRQKLLYLAIPSCASAGLCNIAATMRAKAHPDCSLAG